MAELLWKIYVYCWIYQCRDSSISLFSCGKLHWEIVSGCIFWDSHQIYLSIVSDLKRPLTSAIWKNVKYLTSLHSQSLIKCEFHLKRGFSESKVHIPVAGFVILRTRIFQSLSLSFFFYYKVYKTCLCLIFGLIKA